MADPTPTPPPPNPLPSSVKQTLTESGGPGGDQPIEE